jgi:exonuclease III
LLEARSAKRVEPGPQDALKILKAVDAEFPAAAIRKAGYHAVWRGQKAWNGVAILGRGAEPVVTRTELPGDPSDTQSRYIEVAVNGIIVACIYLPNGNPQPGPHKWGRSDPNSSRWHRDSWPDSP